MKVLVTGATGFLGGIIKNHFSAGTALGLARSGADMNCDLSKALPEWQTPFDYVIHAAGKAHSLPTNAQEEQVFFDVNLKGTRNLTKALEKQPPKGLVFISTVAVYGETPAPNTNEKASENPATPYAQSKLEAEHFLNTWATQNHVPLLILRLPLITGPRPPGNLGKMIKGLKTGKYVRIDKGRACRSMVSAYDVAQFIQKNLGKSGLYNLTDQRDPSFAETEDYIRQLLSKRRPINIPLGLATRLGQIGDAMGISSLNSGLIKKMSTSITFSSQKASQELGWQPNNAIKAIGL
jgi:nucleoside-diphosphate-sugar epimerase